MATSRKTTAAKQDNTTLMTIVTIVLLLIFPLFGLISMWVWTNWSNFVKWVITAIFAIIPVLAILLAITLIAINPAKQLAHANDTERRNHLSQILTALEVEKEQTGQYPSVLPTNAQLISNTLVDLCDELVPDFIPALPIDPSFNGEDIEKASCNTNYNTGYTVYINNNGTIHLAAPYAEGDEKIELTK